MCIHPGERDGCGDLQASMSRCCVVGPQISCSLLVLHGNGTLTANDHDLQAGRSDRQEHQAGTTGGGFFRPKHIVNANAILKFGMKARLHLAIHAPA